MNLGNIALNIFLLKTFFISLCSCYTFFKITASKISKQKITLLFILNVVISIIITFVKYKSNSYISNMCLIFLLSLLCSRITDSNTGHAILSITISLSLNYILFCVAIIISYFINCIYAIKNDYVNLLIMIIIQTLSLSKILKIKRIKNGFSFLNKVSKDQYLDIIVLDVSLCILFSFIIISNINAENIKFIRSSFVCFIIFVMIMIITITKSIELYYKQRLIIKELEENKLDLINKEKEIQKLEQENLNYSKKSHSLAHKQKSLEYKLNQLMQEKETPEEIDIKNRLENISKELYSSTATIEVTKTDIPEIDDMLEFMKSECEKNNIDFNLQISGNIYHMINNIITKEELEIVIADHVKDAIIAIKHTDNVNKSILVKLGKIDEYYGLYIYDSGVEFEKETLENLGKKPSTTYADEGGTGMGFMNTFDTLRKYNASLIINEIGKPTKDNYTKIIMIKFDNKNEFKVISYR